MSGESFKGLRDLVEQAVAAEDETGAARTMRKHFNRVVDHGGATTTDQELMTAFVADPLTADALAD